MLFRSSVAIAVGGTVAGSGPALSEVVPNPEIRAVLSALLTACGIALADAFMRRIRQRRRNAFRSDRSRKPRRNQAPVNQPKQ